MTERDQFESINQVLAQYTEEYIVECVNKAASAASPKVPQGAEEWIDMHSVGASLFDREVLCVAACDLRAYLSGMAIVPVDCITTVARDVEYSPHTSRHTPFLRINFAYDDYDSRDRVYAMLAATKEKQS